ncbi:hypothetical protein ACI2OX_13270 [Bacillus sp. N9]
MMRAGELLKQTKNIPLGLQTLKHIVQKGCRSRNRSIHHSSPLVMTYRHQHYCNHYKLYLFENNKQVPLHGK